MYRAHQAAHCPTCDDAAVHRLDALNAKIDAMTPTGNTNVTIGMQMAWQTLSPSHAPFNAPAPAPDLDKVIILLTDGETPRTAGRRANTSIDARTREGLRQRQGRQYQALYGARDRRQRHAAQELRDQAGHVFRRAAGGPAQQRVCARSRKISQTFASQNSRSIAISFRGLEPSCSCDLRNGMSCGVGDASEVGAIGASLRQTRTK